MNTAIVGVGSNINPKANIKKAEEALRHGHVLLKKSKFSKTKPIGYLRQADFINGAFLIHTADGKKRFQSYLKKLEKTLGRRPSKIRFGPRTIDLDILVWNGKAVHGDFYTRKFMKAAALSLQPDLNF